MVKIERVWSQSDDEHNITLLNRPRISIEVDKYIWGMIEQHIILPKKLMRSIKYDYKLIIALHKYVNGKQNFFPLSPYNGVLRKEVQLQSSANSQKVYKRQDFIDGTGRTRWFFPEKFWTNTGIKTAFVRACAENVDENINPLDYADILYDAFSALLLNNFQKIKKAEMDQLKNCLEKDIICSFRFPAPFNEQKYQGDNSSYQVTRWENDRTKTVLIDISNIEEFYKKHYRE